MRYIEKHSMKMMSVMSDLVNLSLIKIARKALNLNYPVTMSDLSLRKGWWDASCF